MDDRRNPRQSPWRAPEELKLEVAEELGLLEKVKRLGWSGLSAAESGRIGGVITHKLRTSFKEERPSCPGDFPKEPES
ncbi:MAG: small, acid-soluble spore protein, alpha/beta type [Bacillota bacterium]